MYHPRSWGVLIGMSIASVLALGLAVPSHADSRRWDDKKCDVFGYDWYADENFSGECAGIDIRWVEANNSRHAVSVTVRFDVDFPWYTKQNEKQRVWFNTDKDRRPEYLATAYRPNYEGTVGRLAKVDGWAGSGTTVDCAEDFIRIYPGAEKLLVKIPRSCLSKFGAVKVAVQSNDRFDGDKSWRRDWFPAKRAWSNPLRRG